MNIPSWTVLALIAPLAAAQQTAAPGAPVVPPVTESATSSVEFESLAALARPARSTSRLQPAASVAAVRPAMRELAARGNGRALAWCARHLEASDAAPADAAWIFDELVRGHADAPWLAEPQFDPLSALARADAATRLRVGQTLATGAYADEASLRLSLLLRAAALAPRHAGEAEGRAEALGLLAELRERGPLGPLGSRSADLIWRLEHMLPGAPAPTLQVFDVDGNEVLLADLVGREVLVDVWRADDPDLGEHLAALRGLLARVAGLQPGRRPEVIGVGLGGDSTAFRRELEELDLDWTTSFERDFRGRAGEAWHLDGLAGTYWIDAQGILRGVALTLPELEARLLAPVVHRESAPRSEPLAPPPTDEGRDAAPVEVRR